MQTALITGASRGIGRAIAIELAKEQHLHILINYHSNEAAAQSVKEEIEQAGGSAELLPFAVEDKTAVDESIQNWQEQHPEHHIQVLVNNAGIIKDGWFMLMQEQDWNKVLDVSLKGFYNVTYAVIRDMMKQKYGRIINISSVAGLKGTAGQVNYSTAKAGLIGATKALAQEVGRQKITVNAIAPGFIETDMLEHIPMEQYLSAIPLRRVGKAEEVAALVSFLASSKSSYITGEVININGGLYS